MPRLNFRNYVFHAGLKVAGGDEMQRWPCKSSHRLVVSLDGVKPLIITLPHPILPGTIKATLRRTDGVLDLVASKALNDLWPEDVIRDQFRWIPDKLEPMLDMESIHIHVKSQFSAGVLVNPKVAACVNPDVLTRIRRAIAFIFNSAVVEKIMLFEICDAQHGSPEFTEWLIRVQLPVRTSPRGVPVLLLSAMDMRKVERRPRLDGQQPFSKEFLRTFDDLRGLSTKLSLSKLRTAEEVQLFRHILRFNSTKIQPTSWQKKNLPQGGNSPWLATFIRPLYFDGDRCDTELRPADVCCYCTKQNANLKRCGSCKSISYCSVECQRAHWPIHKLFCSRS